MRPPSPACVVLPVSSSMCTRSIRDPTRSSPSTLELEMTSRSRAGCRTGRSDSSSACPDRSSSSGGRCERSAISEASASAIRSVCSIASRVRHRQRAGLAGAHRDRSACSARRRTSSGSAQNIFDAVDSSTWHSSPITASYATCPARAQDSGSTIGRRNSGPDAASASATGSCDRPRARDVGRGAAPARASASEQRRADDHRFAHGACATHACRGCGRRARGRRTA